MKLTLFPLLALSLVAQTPEPAKQTPKAPEAAKPAEKKENKVVAVIANQVVRDSDIDAILEAIPQLKAQIASNPSARGTFIQNYAEVRLLAEKARKEALHKTPGYALKLKLQEDQLLRGEYIAKMQPEIKKRMEVSDADLQAYFEKNKDRFKTPDKATARHILVSVKDEPVAPAKDAKPEDIAKAKEAAKAASDAAAKAKIAKIQELLKQGKKLEELAKEYSDDPGSKDKGGVYEDFDPSQMVAPFAEAVRKQELGKVGEPVKTDYGYHLIEVTKRELGAVQEFDKVKEQVRSAMMPQRQEEVGKAFMNELKAEITCVTGEAAEEAARKLENKSGRAAGAKKPAKGAAK